MFLLDDPPCTRMSSRRADPIASEWLASWEQIPSDGPVHHRSLDRECILDTVRADGLGLCALRSCVVSCRHVPWHLDEKPRVVRRREHVGAPGVDDLFPHERFAAPACSHWFYMEGAAKPTDTKNAWILWM